MIYHHFMQMDKAYKKKYKIKNSY